MEEKNLTEFSFAPLKEFEPALIFLFQSEASIQHVDPDRIDCFLYQMGQYQDMFDAYLFAQNTVLVTIREKGIANISTSQLLEWLNQLHLQIAATLSKDGSDRVAGVYCKEQLIRWANSSIKEPIHGYFTGQQSFEGLLKVVKESGLNTAHFELFLNLLKKIGNYQLDTDNSTDYSYARVPKEKLPAFIGLLQLPNLYHTNKLQKEEKELINKFIQIVIHPSEIQNAMEGFAKDLLLVWRQCKSDNIDAGAQLASKAFQLTNIHPYFNGNTRVTICLMNIILRSLNLPSICLRYPGDNDDPNSTYYNAMKNIDNLNSLPNLIKMRLSEAETFSRLKGKLTPIAKSIEDRITIYRIINMIKKEFPNVDIDGSYQKFTKCCLELQASPNYDNQKNVEIFKTGFTNLYQSLKRTNVSKKILPSIKREYTMEERKTIIHILEMLTNHKEWVPYKTNGLTILLTVNDKLEATAIINKLKKTNALNAKSMKNTDTGKQVVLIDDIKLEDLNKFYLQVKRETSPEKVTYQEQVSRT